MALRATVVTLVAHGESALAEDDRSLLVTCEALERALSVDRVRDRWRRTVVGAVEAPSREDLGALLRGLHRNFREQAGQRVAQPHQRTRVEVRVRAGAFGTELSVTRGRRRPDDLCGGAGANELTLLREARAEAERSDLQYEPADDTPA